ncbi:MAG: hypothetical protein PUC76_03810 [Clostridia bacterium]|nr:hypothetical protein [Clostridia bacterium]
MQSSFGMLTMFELLIGVYLIYAAIKSDGKLYENDYLKCSREEYVKGMRRLALLTGVIMLLSSGLELLGVTEPNSVLSWILWFITFGSIILMMVYSVKKTDREAAKAGKSTGAASPEKPHDPLRAAFVFDDDEDEEQSEGK